MDGGMTGFTITLFTKKFLISSCKRLVCHKIFLFVEQSFDFPFHMPADGYFWYFQYNFMFDISE